MKQEEEIRRVEFETIIKYEKMLRDRQDEERNKHFQNLVHDRTSELVLHEKLQEDQWRG